MMLTAIGLPTDRKGNPVYDKIQDWMLDHDLTPYMPQLRYATSYNLGMAFDPLTGGLAWRKEHPYGWTAQMIAECQRFGHCSVFHYSTYWYASRPDVLRWGGVGQDALTLAQMAGYLRLSRIWFEGQGIDPWIMVDEPPHPSSMGLGDDPGHWGWTPAIEQRIVKFVAAAVQADWLVGVAMPSPQQLAYWRPRIHPSRWILHDSATGWPALDEEVWRYNAKSFDGLGARLHKAGATGYLQWTAVKTSGICPALFDAAGDPIPAAYQLLDELAYVPPLTLDERMTNVERRLDAAGL